MAIIVFGKSKEEREIEKYQRGIGNSQSAETLGEFLGRGNCVAPSLRRNKGLYRLKSFLIPERKTPLLGMIIERVFVYEESSREYKRSDARHFDDV